MKSKVPSLESEGTFLMRSVIVVRYLSPLFQSVPVQLVIQPLPGDTQLLGCIRRVPGGGQGLRQNHSVSMSLEKLNTKVAFQFGKART